MKKKKKRDDASYRKLKVGSLKGQSRKLARLLEEREIPLDKEIIHNSCMAIVREGVCCGYEQRIIENRNFKDKKAQRTKRNFDKFKTQVEDNINKNK